MERATDNVVGLINYFIAQATGIPAATIDQILAEVASTAGFAQAADCLQAELTREPGKNLDHRHNIIARLAQLKAHPLAAAEFHLEPGWQWTATKAQLIQQGKNLKAVIEQNGD